jgi:predicted GNAT family acetyltransferase
MEVRRVDDPAAFLAVASPLLLEDEARHNLMLGIAGTLRDHPSHFPEHYLWVAEDAAGVQGAAVRTPPYHLVLARPREASALDALAAGIEDELPGIVGAVPEVGTFGALWAARTGVTPRKGRAQGIFQLDRVDPVSGVTGRMRGADVTDRPLLIEWWRAFAQEALGEHVEDEPAAHSIDHRLAAADAGAVFWLVDEQPVSFAAFGNPTPNGIRIGPVYTPPERRRRGYASALVADLSARLLADRRFCFLYTDLANPTANRIYEEIGYRRIAEAAEIRFEK